MLRLGLKAKMHNALGLNLELGDVLIKDAFAFIVNIS